MRRSSHHDIDLFRQAAAGQTPHLENIDGVAYLDGARM
jgi:hypothetical protein